MIKYFRLNNTFMDKEYINIKKPLYPEISSQFFYFVSLILVAHD